MEAGGNSTGSNNIAIGNLSGSTVIPGSISTGPEDKYLRGGSGSNNTAIGHKSHVASQDLSNTTAIGYGAVASASNKIRLGNADITSIEGQVAFSSASDRRIKKHIVNTKYGLNTVLKLRPVDYQLKANSLEQIGFIAQELRFIVPEAVIGIEGDLRKGETLGLTYTALIPVLTKAIQEQDIVIQQLKKDIELLKQNANL